MANGYITPGKSAKPDVYNLLKAVPNIVMDALNVGMGRKSGAEVERAVKEFVIQYGLLRLMTALSTIPSFMNCEADIRPKTISSKKNPWRRTNICPCFTLLTIWTW